MARIFSATAYAGRLYIDGVRDRGPWNDRALAYQDESIVDGILNVGVRKVSTPEGLRAAVEASRLRNPSIRVWIAEGLEEAAREVWESCNCTLDRGTYTA